MYESPVKISYDDMHAKMVQAADGQILATIQQLVSVDKDELIRALQYDRGQYEKGYEDGKRDAVRHGHWIKHIYEMFPADSTMECSECHESQPLFIDDDFCPKCGARMDG